MEVPQFLQDIAAAYGKGEPFILFAPPESEAMTLLIDPEFTNWGPGRESGPVFLFMPFEEGTAGYAASLRGATTVALPGRPSSSSKRSPVHQKGKRAYMDLIQKAVQQLRRGSLKKVVLSRTQELSLRSFDIQVLIRSLFAGRSQLFRYLWFHPGEGLWVGSTPEILLSLQDRRIHSMSLAGTRSFGPKVQWTAKEREEQAYVTRFLQERLEPFCQEIHLTGPYNQEAGQLVHLRTDLVARLKTESELDPLLRAIHPTPAVCGTPLEEARSFILDNEGYSRAFYTGYLGPVEPGWGRASLYVNLRCMRIKDQRAVLYTGGGITAQSVPESEWEETCAKQHAMLRLLHDFL